MRNLLIKLFILSGMLLGLPLLGIVLAGYPVLRYLEFPPKTPYVIHAPFSWIAFMIYSLFITGMVLPLLIQAIKGIHRNPNGSANQRRFPWWGWCGVLTGGMVWILAWTRFSWFAPFQPHTFAPLWGSYILVINALRYRKTGHCMMLDRPGFFLLLFPISAAFWWFFEYLNRFVQNWQYTGVHYPPWEYFGLASLSFATVLPAVLGTREWIFSAAWIEKGFAKFLFLKCAYPKALAGAFLIISASGLTGIGVWPDYLFPLLWISPLIIIVSVQVLLDETHIFADILQGDWRFLISAALAALVCGWFWEMWNYYSLAKWEYSVPFVNRFRFFEMPVLGFAGYLPFGLECAIIGKLLEQGHSPPRGKPRGSTNEIS